MRISVLTHMLHPIRSPYEGRLEMHTAMTVEHLVRRGHDVTVSARVGTRVPGDVVAVAGERAVTDAAPDAEEDPR